MKVYRLISLIAALAWIPAGAFAQMPSIECQLGYLARLGWKIRYSTTGEFKISKGHACDSPSYDALMESKDDLVIEFPRDGNWKTPDHLQAIQSLLDDRDSTQCGFQLRFQDSLLNATHNLHRATELGNFAFASKYRLVTQSCAGDPVQPTIGNQGAPDADVVRALTGCLIAQGKPSRIIEQTYLGHSSADCGAAIFSAFWATSYELFDAHLTASEKVPRLKTVPQTGEKLLSPLFAQDNDFDRAFSAPNEVTFGELSLGCLSQSVFSFEVGRGSKLAGVIPTVVQSQNQALRRIDWIGSAVALMGKGQIDSPTDANENGIITDLTPETLAALNSGGTESIGKSLELAKAPCREPITVAGSAAPISLCDHLSDLYTHRLSGNPPPSVADLLKAMQHATSTLEYTRRDNPTGIARPLTEEDIRLQLQKESIPEDFVPYLGSLQKMLVAMTEPAVDGMRLWVHPYGHLSLGEYGVLLALLNPAASYTMKVNSINPVPYLREKYRSFYLDQCAQTAKKGNL